MSEANKQLKELDDYHVIEKLKLLQYISENSESDIKHLVEGFVKEDMLSTWKSICERAQDNTMDTLVKILWHEMCGGNGFKYDVTKTNEGIQIECTYCPYVELAKKANSMEMGYRLYCSADPYIVEGFNDEIGFKRTKTLMEGHDCCNHFYYNKPK